MEKYAWEDILKVTTKKRWSNYLSIGVTLQLNNKYHVKSKHLLIVALGKCFQILQEQHLDSKLSKY